KRDSALPPTRSCSSDVVGSSVEPPSHADVARTDARARAARRMTGSAHGRRAGSRPRRRGGPSAASPALAAGGAGAKVALRRTVAPRCRGRPRPRETSRAGTAPLRSRIMAWVALLVAGLLEMGWAVGLKYAE